MGNPQTIRGLAAKWRGILPQLNGRGTERGDGEMEATRSCADELDALADVMDKNIEVWAVDGDKREYVRRTIIGLEEPK